MWSLFCTDGYLLKVRITLLVRNGSKYLEERQRSKLLGCPLIAVAKGTFEVRRAGLTQFISYPLRLPDEAQTDALRLLDVSREVINAVVVALWPQLDEFGKQVEAMISSPLPHGHRQFRCEAEQAGRILRAQAQRKKQFAFILPILSYVTETMLRLCG
jgi:hypothetical protein